MGHQHALYVGLRGKGLMGRKPYPAVPAGTDLCQNREELLARYQRLSEAKSPQELKTGTN